MAYEYKHVFDFRGGLNDSVSPDNLGDNEVLHAENVELSNRGGFTRRFGIDEWCTVDTGKPIDRLLEFEFTNDGVKQNKILALSDGKLIDTDTGDVLRSSLNNKLDYTVYKGKVYILSNDNYMIYDGATIEDVVCEEEDSNLDRIKKCKFVTQRSDRFFFAGNPDDPNALYFSELGKPEYAKVVSVIQAISSDADSITGLSNFHGAMLVFKSRRVFAWFGYDPMVDVEFHELDAHTGTKSYRTIKKVENMLLFLGEDGVYALTGIYKDVISTVKVSNTINEKTSLIKQDPTYDLDTACAVYNKGKYMLSVATTEPGINDLVLVLHTDFFKPKESEPWVIYTGWNISDFLPSLDGNLYSASSVAGRVHIHTEKYNDLNEGIALRVTLKPMAMEAPVHNKKFRRGYVAVRQYMAHNTTFNILTTIDYRTREHYTSPDESLTWDLRPWDYSEFGTIKWDFIDLVTRRFDIKEKGKRLIIEITDDAVDQSLTVYGFGIEYKIKKPDRRE